MPDAALPLKLRLFRQMLFHRIFPWFGAGIPGRLVYSSSLTLGRTFGPYFQHGESAQPMYRDGCSQLLGLFLREFAQLGKAFDLPIVVHGLDQVASAYSQHRRLVLCSIHLPLNRCLHRALAPLRIPSCVITTSVGPVPPYVLGIPDAQQPTRLFPGPSLYFQVRSALSEGRIVITDIDRWYRNRTIGLTSGPIEFAARTQTPILFFATALDRNGEIRVVFSRAHTGAILENRTECLDSFAEFLRPFVGEQDRFCWENRHDGRRAA